MIAQELQLSLLNFENPWVRVKDGNPVAAALYRRHYTCRQYRDRRRDNPAYRNRNLICGPGEKMVLITPDSLALFVWRKFIDDSGQKGINCAAFRNESIQLSSKLILWAEEYAQQRWPGERLYTYVDPSKVRPKRDPGYCFLKAGWKKLTDATASGKLIFEKVS